MQWKKLARVLIGFALSCGTVAGCDRDARQGQSGTPTSKRVVAADPTATGVIRGRVLFAGTPPVMQSFANDHCRSGHSEPIRDESVVVGKSGGLKNVVVYVKDVPGMSPGPAPVLDQVDCRYVPHVVAVSVGQQLVIKSSDPTIHNVHIQSERSPANIGMPGPGSIERAFGAAECFRVRCEVHPWMSAWVAVLDTPCYGVTDDDGSFEIRNVPPGTRQIALWHERYAAQEQSVDVPAEEPIQVNFTVKP